VAEPPPPLLPPSPPPAEEVGVSNGDLLKVLEPLREGERVSVVLTVPERVNVAQELPLGVKVLLRLSEAVVHTVAHGVGDSVPAHRAVGVTEVHMVRDAEGEPVVDRVRVEHALTLGDAETERDTVPMPEREELALTDALFVAPEGVLLVEMVPEADALGEGDWLLEADGDAEGEGVGDSDTEPQVLPEKLAELDTVTVEVVETQLDAEGEELAEGHRVDVPLRERVGLPEKDRVTVGDLLRVTLLVRLPVPQELALRLRVPVTLTVPERERVPHTLTVGERLCDKLLLSVGLDVELMEGQAEPE